MTLDSFPPMLQIGDLGIAFWISTSIAIFFGIIAIILPLYFSRKGKRFMQLAYTVATANLIQDFSTKLSGLKIEYKGKNPANISVSKIAIWSDGNVTVDHTDVADAEPLKILCDGDILDWSVVDSTTPANQFVLSNSTSGNGPMLSISFDYLDRNDGGIIQLIHSGKSSASIKMVGRVKGSGQPLRREFGPNVKIVKLSNQITVVAFAVITLGFIGAINGNPVPIQDLGYVGIGIGVVLFILGLIVGQLARRFGTVPKRFESAKNVV